MRAIAAVFSAYAAKHGKPRWGDKTPMDMRHLALIDRLFPAAQYVHLIRDGRDAALAFLDLPAGVVTKTWAHPRSAAGFACEWRTGSAREGSRYVSVARATSKSSTTTSSRALSRPSAASASSPVYLSSHRCSSTPEKVDISAKTQHQRLRQPPTHGVRDWRTQMAKDDIAAFDRIAGDLLAELGYEGGGRQPARTVPSEAWYRLRMGAWNVAAYATQRSPLWQRRHPRLF